MQTNVEPNGKRFQASLQLILTDEDLDCTLDELANGEQN